MTNSLIVDSALQNDSCEVSWWTLSFCRHIKMIAWELASWNHIIRKQLRLVELYAYLGRYIHPTSWFNILGTSVVFRCVTSPFPSHLTHVLVPVINCVRDISECYSFTTNVVRSLDVSGLNVYLYSFNASHALALSYPIL